MKNEQTALQLFSSDTTDRVVVAAPQLEPPLLHAAAGIRYGDQKNMWEADPNISNIDELWCVLEEILGRLAISDIRNCRLVSKKWNYLICSESFVGRVKSQHGIEGKLFIHDRFSAAEGMTLKFEDGETMYTENCGVIDLLYMRSPLILGSVHDLVLIADDENKKRLLILNASTRLWHRIADENPHGFEGLYGLGYSKAEADYKVVEVFQELGEDTNESMTSANFFSLRSDTWTKRNYPEFTTLLSKSVGCLHGQMYFCDSKYDTLITFDLSSGDFGSIPLPLSLRGQRLTFGVTREKLISGFINVREVLLICSYNREEGRSSLWRLRKDKEGDRFENLALLGDDRIFQPLSYLLGDPNMILLLQDRRAIQVYNVVDKSTTEVYRDGGTEEGETGGIDAIGFYDTKVSAPIDDEIFMIQRSGTKRKYGPVVIPNKLPKSAMKKTKQD